MKKDFSHLEAYRCVDGKFATPVGATYGAFAIPHTEHKQDRFLCAVDDGTGPEQQQWEHVSVRLVSIVEAEQKTAVCRPPSIIEVDEMKRMFWDDDEAVVQIHQGEIEQDDNKAVVAHLWKPRIGSMMFPTEPQPETQKTE